jgi:hypothetical protein
MCLLRGTGLGGGNGRGCRGGRGGVAIKPSLKLMPAVAAVAARACVCPLHGSCVGDSDVSSICVLKHQGEGGWGGPWPLSPPHWHLGSGVILHYSTTQLLNYSTTAAAKGSHGAAVCSLAKALDTLVRGRRGCAVGVESRGESRFGSGLPPSLVPFLSSE